MSEGPKPTREQFEPGFEPERYEMDAPGAAPYRLDRRGFFQLLGGGIVILFLLDGTLAQESGGGRRRGGRGVPQEVGAWLHIGEEGGVTVYTGKVEVGQNIRTSLAQVVAEELRATVTSIRLVMADTQLTPFDAGTFGSRTTPDMAQRLRKVAAAAREILIDLAAETWKVDRAALAAGDGRVRRKDTGETLPYGRLTKGQKLTRTVSDATPTTPAESWTVMGRSAPRVDGRAMVTGQHRYTSDMKLPGMLYGKVLRPPSFGATLVSLSTKEAEAMPGVIVVREGEFTGVAAPAEHLAARALEAIKAEWKAGPLISGKSLFGDLKQGGQQAGGGRVPSAHRAGSIQEGLEAAAVRLAQSYTVAYIAHAPLEPRAALAQWENDRLTVWTGTQRPFGVRSELAEALRIPEDSVRVIVPDTGSGYGGKHTGEAALEAARLARAAGNRSASSGAGRKSSPGRTSGPRASSTSPAARGRTGR
jgi:CO/xanthine dehydrogenase Mo-binding subunit